MVGVHQPGIGRDDAVTVGIGVIAGGDVVAVLLGHQAGHRAGRAAIHADLSVPVQRHETPGAIDQRIDHRQIQLVALGDRAPVIDRGAPERIGPDAHAGRPDRIQIEHAGQVVHIAAQIVVGLGRLAGTLEGHAPHPLHAGSDVLVGLGGNPSGGIGVGRTAVRRVVLEAAIGRRIVRRGDDDAIGQTPVGRQLVDTADLALVGLQDGMRHRRRRRVAVGSIDEDVHVIGHQHLQRTGPGRLRQRVGVTADEQRAIKALRLAVVADRLRGGQDVILVERGLEAAAPMPRGAERHLLVDDLRIGLADIIGRDEAGEVDQVLGLGHLAGAGVRHEALLQ